MGTCVVAPAFLFRRALPRSAIPIRRIPLMPIPEFRRKPHRLANEEYRGQKWYFITMCSEKRAPIFTGRVLSNWLIDALRKESQIHGFLIDAYCLMPDHLHFLALGIAPASDLLRFAKMFKQKTAHAYLRKTSQRLWQKNYYDHILRSIEEPSHVAAYIWLNPVRKRLCKDFETYPYSGSFTNPKRILEEASWTPPWKHPPMPA